MSSHHFVKEGQEPALVLTGLLYSEHLKSLLEWAPLVIVFETALDEVLAWGIKADMIVALESSVKKIAIKVEHQAPVKIFSCNTPGEYFGTAMEVLISLKQFQVTMGVAVAEDWFDLAAGYVGRLEINLVDETTKWAMISSGKFQKWYPQHTEILTKSSGPLRVSEVEIEPAKGIITQNDGIITIESDGVFWVGESLK
jgi:hypothetical protein